MINSIAIENFKRFRNFKLSPLSRVTLVGGANNVGKTTLLDAIFAVYNRLSPDLILRQYAGRGFNFVPGGAENIWWPIFNEFRTDREIRILFNWDTNNHAEEKLSVKLNKSYAYNVVPFGSDVAVRGSNTPSNQPEMQSYALDVIYSKNNQDIQVSHVTVAPNGLLMKTDFSHENPKPASIMGGRLISDYAMDAQMFGSLDVDYRASSVTSFLKDLEPRLKGLSVIAWGNKSVVYGDIGMEKKMPVAFMGDGISRLLTMILAIATCRDGVVLIDEIENGIHYSAMRNIWRNIGKAAREYNCQVVATTHSYECIAAAKSGFAGGMQEDFSYVRLDKINGHIVPKVYTYDSISVALDAEMEVR